MRKAFSKPEPPSRHHSRPERFLVALVVAFTVGCAGVTSVTAPQSSLPAERLLAVDGHLVHVEELGPADGEPVVLVHGFGSSGYTWRLVAPRLADAGYRVVMPDLYGFGWSDRPEEPFDYTPTGQAVMVRRLMDRLGIERAHLVGHSFGGGVALKTWEAAPGRVLSLSLVATTLPTISRAPNADLPLYRPLAYVGVRLLGLTRWFVRAALERSVFDPAFVTREMVDAYRARLGLVGPAGRYDSLTRPIPRERLEISLSQVEAPVLLVWGEDDRLIPIKHGRRAAPLFPDATLVVYPETGHLVMEERPETLTRRLLQFLDEHRSAPVDPERSSAERAGRSQ